MKLIPKPLLVFLGLLTFSAVLFRAGAPEGTVIQSMDYNYGLMAMYKAELPGAFFAGFWRSFPLLGKVGTLPLTFPFLALAVLPLEFYMDWIYAIHLFLASLFFIGFLRLRGLDWAPVCAGTLVALWLGNHLTLVHPGHLLKYGVVLCACATLFSLEKLFQSRSWRWAVLSGGFLGWMFMHQADVALFFGLILGAYTLFRASLAVSERRLGQAEAQKSDLPQLGKLLALLVGVAGLITWNTFEEQMNTQVRTAEVLQSGTPSEKWDFATQWSFPPTESMDLIAPGYWGWSSVDQEAPYHGLTGQSTAWERTGQGLVNLRLESVYLGVLAFGLIILSVFPGSVPTKERAFWLSCLVITLLLSFGEFSPLYRLFYQLPLVSNIRNPNKFLQVFQLCAGVLAAFGLQHKLSNQEIKLWKGAAIAFLFLAVFLGLSSILVQPDSPIELKAFTATPWESAAQGILQTRKLALLHASLLAAWSAVCMITLRYARWRTLGVAGVILALGVDSLYLGHHYLKPDRVEFLQENALAEFLTENLGTQRVAILQPDPIHDYYISHLFPAHHIAFADIRVAPRLEQDYQDYFDVVGAKRLQVWREFGVKYVLAPRSLAEAMMEQNPVLKSILPVAWSYDLLQSPTGNLHIQPATPARPGGMVVLEFTPPSDRFTLLNEAAPVPKAETLSAINSGTPSSNIAQVHTPDFTGFSHSGSPGTIKDVLPSQQGFLLNVQVDSPQAFLRLADRYDPRLRVSINGEKPQPLHPVDVLFAGIELPAGLHQVELSADLSSASRTLQLLSLLICFGVGIRLLLPYPTRGQ